MPAAEAASIPAIAGFQTLRSAVENPDISALFAGSGRRAAFTSTSRRMIAGSSEQEGISMVLSMMDRTKDNEDFVARFDQWAKMMGNGGARQ